MRGNLTQEIEAEINIDKFMDYVIEQIKSAIEKISGVSECEIVDWDMDGVVLRAYGRYETGCNITRFPATEYEPADIDIERDCEFIPNEQIRLALPEELRDLLTVAVHERDYEYEAD
jgi:hypothetical protein